MLPDGATYEEANTLLQSRYYSAKYWAAKFALDPNNDHAFEMMVRRQAEVEQLREARKAARRWEAKRPLPVPQPHVIRRMRAKRELPTLLKDLKEEWKPQPLSWD